MKYLVNLIWAIIAFYLCQLSITNATADKTFVAPEVGYRFETNRNILVENDNIVISTAACTEFSLRNQNANKIIKSIEESKTPLGVRNCSPYYKVTDQELSTGLWVFTGGISEYEIAATNSATITLIEPEISKKSSRAAFYILFVAIWGWLALFTDMFFKKRTN